MGGSGACDVGQRAGHPLLPGDMAKAGQVAAREKLGGAANGKRLERLRPKQEKRNQLLVADGFHSRIALGGGIDRGIVPGTPGHGQPHD